MLKQLKRKGKLSEIQAYKGLRGLPTQVPSQKYHVIQLFLLP